MTTDPQTTEAAGPDRTEQASDHDYDSTSDSTSHSPQDSVLDSPWVLHPRVSLRPEPFGALAYHYDNRKLQFLRSPDLVDLVASLGNFKSPRDAFDGHDIDPARWPSFAKALRSLADSKFIQPATKNTDSE